ncbi:MAG: DNA polymerase IV [Propionicimonas sp.]|nr:DNA polymerase IV [Propionicimonas sp.]
MRATASVLHLDLDAFFAAVEQRDKPSLRGRPVIVGGIGQRGVVSTASYEARRFGVHSAMPTHEARRRCPNAAFLTGRFDAYRKASLIVMGLLRELSPLVEALSLDEAFVDLAAGPERSLAPDDLVGLAGELRARVAAETGGLTASVGLGTSKFIAKVASELAKPDGVRLVRPGEEVATISGLPARAIPGVGPATMERLSRLGVEKVRDLQRLSSAELVRELGRSAGETLFQLAQGIDERAVEPDRDTKSISVEDTFEHDIADPGVLAGILERQAGQVAERLSRAGLFARTVTIKLRWPDFSSVTRSRTLLGATDRPEAVTAIARDLLGGLETSPGVRLLGVGVSGLVGVAQEALFDLAGEAPVVEERAAVPDRRPAGWLPGTDVVHDELGPGWVWGSGHGVVTVRFETAETGPGPVRSFAVADPALHRPSGDDH